MKKIYTLAGVLLMAGAVNAQAVKNTPTLLKKIEPARAVMLKAPLDTIWSDDFSDGLGNIGSEWEVSHDATVGTLDWSIETDNTICPRGEWPTMDFTSFANGFAWIDSDADGQGNQQNADITMVNGLDLTLFDAVSIQFQHIYRTFEDRRTIQVSTDDFSTFTEYVIHEGVNSEANENSLNPSLYSLNISDAAANNTNVKVRFHYEGDWSWFWAIDEVAITETPDNDIAATEAWWSFGNPTTVVPYSQIPSALAQDITFNTVVNNNGASTQPNSTLTVNMSGAASMVYNGTPKDVLASAQDTLVAGPAAVADYSTVGTYDFTYSVASDSIDGTPSDNSLTGLWSTELTDNTYARDNGTYEGYYLANDADDDLVIDYQSEYQIDYEINNTITIYSMKVVIADNTAPGTEIYYNIYDGAGTALYDGVAEAQPTYELQAGDLTSAAGSEVWIDLPFTSGGNPGIELNPINGEVFTFGIGNEIDSLFLGISGDALSSETLGDWYSAVQVVTQSSDNSTVGYILGANPMIRLNFLNTVGINEENADVVTVGQNMPNPFNATTAIPFNLVNAAEVEFAVTDVTGKIIENRDLGTLSAGAHSIDFSANTLADGIYYYSVIVNGKATTKKFTVAK